MRQQAESEREEVSLNNLIGTLSRADGARNSMYVRM